MVLSGRPRAKPRSMARHFLRRHKAASHSPQAPLLMSGDESWREITHVSMYPTEISFSHVFLLRGTTKTMSSALLALFLLKFHFGQSHRKSDIFLTGFSKSITDALHITVCMKESSTPRTIENPNCAESRERAPQKPTDAHALEHLAHTMFSDATTTVSSMVSPPAIYSHSFPR